MSETGRLHSGCLDPHSTRLFPAALLSVKHRGHSVGMPEAMT